MSFELKNYTQHSINLYENKEVKFSLPSLGNIRLESDSQKNSGDWKEIPILTPQKFTGIMGVPKEILESKEEVGLLVSMPKNHLR